MKNKALKNTFKDPVCGMEISRLTAPAICEHKGKTYYFCADVCRDKFEANPEKYISRWPPREHEG